MFKGVHDFYNFCKYTEEYDKIGTTREIYNCEIIITN